MQVCRGRSSSDGLEDGSSIIHRTERHDGDTCTDRSASQFRGSIVLGIHGNRKGSDRDRRSSSTSMSGLDRFTQLFFSRSQEQGTARQARNSFFPSLESSSGLVLSFRDGKCLSKFGISRRQRGGNLLEEAICGLQARCRDGTSSCFVSSCEIGGSAISVPDSPLFVLFSHSERALTGWSGQVETWIHFPAIGRQEPSACCKQSWLSFKGQKSLVWVPCCRTCRPE
ncbi:hypothetical protein V8F33_001832 [Rhypophila sp. PSN 637]